MPYWVFLLLGSLMASFAVVVELFHKAIWDYAVKKYQRPKSHVLYIITRPDRFSYACNVFFVLPLLLMIGLWLISLGINVMAEESVLY